jgi:hypothetical protein
VYFTSNVEEVVTTPPPKKPSGNARSQCASVFSPTIDSVPTVNPIPDTDDIKFPHEAASATDEVKPAAITTNETNTVDHIGGVPVLHMAPAAAGNALTWSTVEAGAQEGSILLEARHPTNHVLNLEDEDDPILDSDDDEHVQPNKKGRKTSRKSKTARK